MTEQTFSPAATISLSFLERAANVFALYAPDIYAIKVDYIEDRKEVAVAFTFSVHRGLAQINVTYVVPGYPLLDLYDRDKLRSLDDTSLMVLWRYEALRHLRERPIIRDSLKTDFIDKYIVGPYREMTGIGKQEKIVKPKYTPRRMIRVRRGSTLQEQENLGEE